MGIRNTLTFIVALGWVIGCFWYFADKRSREETLWYNQPQKLVKKRKTHKFKNFRGRK